MADETNGNGGTKIRQWAPVIFWIASTLVTVTLAYGAVTNRLSVLETKYDRIAEDLRDIKADLKILLHRER